MSVDMVGAEVSYQQPIRRELTHRSAVSEVFVTSLAARATDRFVAGAQLPRMHAYYGDHRGAGATRHDLLAVMEAARQTAIAITHEFYRVPLDSAFMVRTFNGTGVPGPVWTAGPEPADLLLEVEVANLHTKGAEPSGLDMTLEISCGGHPVTTVDGSFTWSAPTEWAGLRAMIRNGSGQSPVIGPVVAAAPAAPGVVGRNNPRNVVVGGIDRQAAHGTAALAIDTAHPFLFDHHLDHVPGSALLEAARQTAVALLPAERRDDVHLLSVTSRYGSFTELDLPAECVAEITATDTARPRAHCAIRQNDVTTAELDLIFLDTRAAA